jgi:hypothetical protein
MRVLVALCFLFCLAAPSAAVCPDDKPWHFFFALDNYCGNQLYNPETLLYTLGYALERITAEEHLYSLLNSNGDVAVERGTWSDILGYLGSCEWGRREHPGYAPQTALEFLSAGEHNVFVALRASHDWDFSTRMSPNLGTLMAMGVQVVSVDFLEEGYNESVAFGALQGAPLATHFVVPATAYPDYIYSTMSAKVLQAMRGAPGHVCTYMSPGHVATADGTAYSFTGVGDWTLWAAAGDTNTEALQRVEVRNVWCTRGDHGESHNLGSPQTPCTVGVALGTGYLTLTLLYDAQHKAVSMLYNGMPWNFAQNPTWEFYDLMYTTTRVLGQDLVHVSVVDYYGVWVNITFSPDFVSIAVSSLYLNGTTGLCGSYDGCPANDFVTATGQVAAGANESVPTWLVPTEHSLLDQFFFRDSQGYGRPPLWSAKEVRTPHTKTSVNSRRHCKGEHVGSGFLYDWCNYNYVNFGGSVDHFSDLPRLYCADYCLTGLSSHAGINADPSVCDGLCDIQMRLLASNLSHFSVFTKYAADNWPAVALYQREFEDVALLNAPLGGEYTFLVAATDCCTDYLDQKTRAVTVKVACKGSIKLEAQDDVEYTPSGNIMAIQIPLTAKLSVKNISESDIHVAWRPIAFPGDVGPVLDFAQSLNPSFSPMAIGEFIFEVVAFDGCQQVFDNVTVIIHCLNFTYGVESMQTMQYHNNQYTPAYIHLYEECETPVTTLDNRIFSYITSLDPLYSHPNLIWERYDDDQWVLYWHVTKEYNKTVHTTTTTTTTPGSQQWTDNQPRWGGNQRRYEIRDTVVQYGWTTQTTTTVHERIWADAQSAECYLSTTRDEDNGRITVRAYPEQYPLTADDVDSFLLNNTAYMPYLTRHAPFRFGSCDGAYTMTYTAQNALSCNNMAETLTLDAVCQGDTRTTVAHTLTPCLIDYYNYAQRRFEAITLEGRDTSIYYTGSPYEWLWTVEKAPAGSGATLANDDTLRPSFTPDAPGTYTIKLAATDRCRIDTDTIDYTVNCSDVVTIAPCVDSAGGVVHWNYTANDVVTLSVNGSTVTHPDAYLTYAWTLVSSPDPLPSFLGLLPPDQRFAGAGFDVDYTPYTSGTYVIGVEASDGCEAKSTQCQFTVQCDNSLSVWISAENATTYYIPPLSSNFGSVQFWAGAASAEPLSPFYWTIEWQDPDTLDYYLWDQTISPANSTLAYPDSAATWRVNVTVYDGCKAATATTHLASACRDNVITPYIQSEAEYMIEDLPRVTLNGTLSSTGTWLDAAGTPQNMPRYYLWSAVDPDGTPVDFFPPDTSAVVWFRPAKLGQYNATLMVSDGCKSASQYFLFNVDCRLKGFVAKAAASATQVAWNGIKFPRIVVNGAGSTLLGNTTESDYTAVWTFLEAPPNSAFKGRNDVNTFTSVANSSTVGGSVPYPVPWSSYMWHQVNTTTSVVTSYKEYTYSTLRQIPNDNYTGEAVPDGSFWAAAFRPDVPGRYQLELAISNACQRSVSLISFQAACNTAPAISATVPAEARVWETLSLDARATLDNDGDKLAFEWEVVQCNADYIYDDTYSVLNTLTRTAFYTPREKGYLCVSLTVTDGCSYVSQDWAIKVSCPRTFEMPPELNDTYTFDGIGAQTVRIDLTQGKNPKNDRSAAPSPFLWGYNWTMVSYAPTATLYGKSKHRSNRISDGAIAGAVIGSVAGACLIAGLVIVGAMMLTRNKGSPGEKPQGVPLEPPAGTPD